MSASAAIAAGPRRGTSFPGSAASASAKRTERGASASGFAANASALAPSALPRYRSDRHSRGRSARSAGDVSIFARARSGSERALASPSTTSAPSRSAATAPARRSAPYSAEVATIDLATVMSSRS